MAAQVLQISNGEAGSSTRAKLNVAIGNDGIITGLVADGATDDAAAINTLIATLTPTAQVPVKLTLQRGKRYGLSTPIVLKSFMTLDISGATLVHLGPQSDNAITNQALATVQRQVTDGVLTANSNTITSATANFTSADIGRSLFSSLGSMGTLSSIFTARITAVNSTTSVTVDAYPSASATGSTLKLYNRDVSITIKGDPSTRIERTSNADGDNNRQHSIRLCRVDRLLIEGLSFYTTHAKYAVLISDVNNFDVRDLYFETNADGVHITGPSSDGRVYNLSGRTDDDMCAFGCTDFPYYIDTQGSISDMVVDGVAGTLKTSTAAVHVFCGNSDPNHSNTRVRIKNISGGMIGSSVKIERGANDVNSVVDDIEVDGVRPKRGPAAGAIVILQDTLGRIKLRNIYDDGASGTAAAILVQTGAIVSRLDVIGFTRTTNSRAPNIVSVAGDIGTLNFEDLDATFNAAANAGMISVAGQASAILLSQSKIAAHSGVSVLSTPTAQTALTVCASDLFMSGFASGYIWVLRGAVELNLNGVHHGTCYMAVKADSNGTVVTVRGAGITWSPTIFVDGNGGTGVVRLLSFALYGEIDRPGIQKNNGDMAFNTKSGLSCGAGPVVCNGTAWKNLYTGATY